MNRYMVRYLLYPIHEWLKRNSTLKVLDELERSQWLSREEIEHIQMLKLGRLLSHVYETVPYYRRLFKAHDIRPDGIQCLRDYQRVPLLSKEMVRRDSDALLSEGFGGRRIRYTTGGSTGEPLRFYVDNERVSNEWAGNWRARRWWGVDIGDRMVSIWASPIDISASSKIKKMRDRLLNNKMVSALDLRPGDIKSYLRIIEDHETEYLFGYSSCLYFMARLMGEQGLSLSRRIKAIFATADTMYDYQREIVEKAFGAQVGLEYGARDGGFIAHECPKRGFHVFEEGVLVEIVDERGLPVPDGQEGEIVLTILDSRVMPFLRYRIGDMGQLSSETCPCGVKLKLMKKLIGRKSDNLVRRDGSLIHGAALANILFTDPNIERYQIIQKGYGDLTVNLVAANPVSEREKDSLRYGFERVFGCRLQIEFKETGDIPTSASGKTRYIINQIMESHHGFLPGGELA